MIGSIENEISLRHLPFNSSFESEYRLSLFETLSSSFVDIEFN